MQIFHDEQKIRILKTVFDLYLRDPFSSTLTLVLALVLMKFYL